MSVWNHIQDSLIERTTIELDLTESERKVVSRIAESYLLEHVRVTLREGQSPWEALAEAPAFGMGMPSMKGPEEEMVINDNEAEAIEDATGQMGVEPPSRLKARKTMMDPKTALVVYKTLQANEPKYSAALGGPQGYALLMKKIVRQLRDRLGMGAKQLNPPTSEPVKDPTAKSSGTQPIAKIDPAKVHAQDVASMKGSKSAVATVKDPKQQKKEPGMEDPSQWDLEDES